MTSELVLLHAIKDDPLQDNGLGVEAETALRDRFGARLCRGREDFRNFTLGDLGLK